MVLPLSTDFSLSVGRTRLFCRHAQIYGTLLHILTLQMQSVISKNMPRRSRIDAPGALHHITVRGIDRKSIFKDDADKDNFLGRLKNILTNSTTLCFAWALIPSHFHLLLRTGSVPISTVMKRLLTGHAIYFNRKHCRVGHLFQNRYKSILCQEDAYLLELV